MSHHGCVTLLRGRERVLDRRGLGMGSVGEVVSRHASGGEVRGKEGREMG